ncbi:major facilitator superfamily transporter [Fusarium oxysporum f. sp. albedinis]|nr:major facilitator superfamily transporter [Fusarium oxysporum f. sp. albedinis]KAK2474731.1 hypothetical protein H9L39_14691 [Fusarium oxysporum f. sp. albedinis]RKK96232.1 hypothetical protein BFJ68_g14494 [Fusarium oxysporum]RYC78074.1 hypothetical protein BFJ63_vAg19052 [Fusarium oxysporum f. sp. narcissi]
MAQYNHIELDSNSIEGQRDLGPPDTGNETPGDTNSDAEKSAPVVNWPANNAPDGGRDAWLCVLGTWCTSICAFGWLNSVGVFQQYYEAGPLRQYSSSTIAWIPSLQIFFMMAMGPIVGKVFDKYGPRYLLSGGLFLHVFGLMMASISHKYYQIMLSQGVCSAIGVAAIFQPGYNCINGWFNRKRGLAFGIVSTGSSLGGIIFPIMLNRLIRSVGYGWAMRTCAFMILLLLIIAVLTIRCRLPPHPHPITRSEMAQPFQEPEFRFLMAGMFFLTFGIYVPIDYLSVEAYAHGMDPSLAQYLVSILNAGSLFGRLFSGYLSDRIGKYNTFVTACATTGILILAFWIPGHGNAATIVFGALFGFTSGAYVSLIAALVVQISPLKEIGFRTGIVFFIGAAPGLVTNPIAGAIIDKTGSWAGLKVFAGVLCLVGTAFIFCTRIARTGWKLLAVF